MTAAKIVKKIATAVFAGLLVAVFLYGCGPSPKLYAQRAASQNVEERRAVMKELRGRSLNDKLIPIVLQGCSDADNDVRMYAFYALGKADPREDGVVPAFYAGMVDTSVLVRRAVAASIGNLNPFPSGLFMPMIKLLIDPDEMVRISIATTFMDLQGGGIGALMRNLDTKDADLRYAIVTVLGLIGSPAKMALPKLKTIAQEDKDQEIKAAASKAVQLIER
jgi:HEAT repeat protein